MTKIEELFKEYKVFQRAVLEGKELSGKIRNQLSEYERNLGIVISHLTKTEIALKDAFAVKIDAQRDSLVRADRLLKEGNFAEVYKILTGKTLQEVVRHILMPGTSTYAKGVHALREACKAEGNSIHPTFTQDDGSQIYRPLTFKEDLEAKVNDYETLENPDGSKRTKEERLKLFNTWLDSCTGTANKKKSTKFKIVPVCKELILIDKDFNQYSLPVNYESVGGVELDSKKGKYNEPLPKPEVLEQPGWRTSLEEDLNLLKTYRDIVSAEKGTPNKLMGFYVREKTDSDQLRALYVDDLGNDSVADSGNYPGGGLGISGSFLRVAQ